METSRSNSRTQTATAAVYRDNSMSTDFVVVIAVNETQILVNSRFGLIPTAPNKTEITARSTNSRVGHTHSSTFR